MRGIQIRMCVCVAVIIMCGCRSGKDRVAESGLCVDLLENTLSLMEHMDELDKLLPEEDYERKKTEHRKLHGELSEKSTWTSHDWQKLCRYLYSTDFRLRCRAMATIETNGTDFHKYEHLLIPFLSDDVAAVHGYALKLLARYGSAETQRFVSNWRYSRDRLEAGLVEGLPERALPKQECFKAPAPRPLPEEFKR